MDEEVIPSSDTIPIPVDLVQAIANVLGSVPSSVGAEVFLALRNYLQSIKRV
jgi:hypothetical protein